jgi:protein-S-isoprenylcysteine O-methyltransferase Ste14
MDLAAIYQWGVLVELTLALVAFPLLFWITVPYGGRHTSERWGPRLPSRMAWCMMELPAPIFCLWAYSQGANAGEPVSLVMLAAFLVHYLERAIVYPLRMRSSGKQTPALSAFAAFAVNVMNGTITGLALGHIGSYGTAWLGDPRFWAGAGIFLVGAAVNHQSDAILRKLRKPGETGYRIPTGGVYRWVSSPNYLGEIVQWGGWALATSSAAGLAFFLITIANLAPRARSNHRWYRSHFDDYPRERRALIPGIW